MRHPGIEDKVSWPTVRWRAVVIERDALVLTPRLWVIGYRRSFAFAAKECRTVSLMTQARPCYTAIASSVILSTFSLKRRAHLFCNVTWTVYRSCSVHRMTWCPGDKDSRHVLAGSPTMRRWCVSTGWQLAVHLDVSEIDCPQLVAVLPDFVSPFLVRPAARVPCINLSRGAECMRGQLSGLFLHGPILDSCLN